MSSFELRGVSAGPEASPILTSVSLDLPCQGITVLAGPSGAGKSSLLRLLNRLSDPVAGTVAWNGRLLSDWHPAELRRRVGMVFQRPPVFRGTVFDNLRVADPALDRGRACRALERVGLVGAIVDRSAGDLSGGEAQRMCFARALLTEPSVLLADEPTTSLDGVARRTIEDLGRSLADDRMPIIWVSHDIDQLRRLADHVVVLIAGRYVASGALSELDHHVEPRVRELVGAS